MCRLIKDSSSFAHRSEAFIHTLSAMSSCVHSAMSSCVLSAMSSRVHSAMSSCVLALCLDLLICSASVIFSLISNCKDERVSHKYLCCKASRERGLSRRKAALKQR